MIVCRDLSQHYGLGFVIDRFSDIMQKTGTLCQILIETEFGSHHSGKGSDFNGMFQAVLAV